MLESPKDSKREAFRAAIERAREDCLSLDDTASMITAAADIEHSNSNGSVHSTEQSDVIYEPGELPEGLIDLPSASKQYGISVVTLRSWVQRGELPRLGRLRARSPGGGCVVTDEASIVYCRDHPQKGGRKKLASSR